MSESVQFRTISEDEAGQRIDNYLLRVLKSAPKSLIYRIIRKGEVRINKGRCKPDRKLQAGDVVRVPPVKLGEKAPPPTPSQQLANHLDQAILYEDPGMLIVNKPSGLAVHGGSGINLGLVEALRQLRNDHYLELVHRLDRDTSGCIVLAKKRSLLRQMHALLRNKEGVNKQYLALVKGTWPAHVTEVNVPLLKNELKSGERVVRVDAEGKPSLTRFSIERTFNECSLVRCSPITGRTHQIRVHALHAKHPLVGDEKYGDDDFNKEMKAKGVRRLFLHAASLDFTLENGKHIHVEAPLPDDLSAALNNL